LTPVRPFAHLVERFGIDVSVAFPQLPSTAECPVGRNQRADHPALRLREAVLLMAAPVLSLRAKRPTLSLGGYTQYSGNTTEIVCIKSIPAYLPVRIDPSNYTAGANDYGWSSYRSKSTNSS
jgi:hypothetical protein